MLFLSVFATCLTLWVSASQAQYLKADLLKNIGKKDYGIVSKNYEHIPATAKFDSKIGSCENLQTLWTRFGCKGSIFSEDQLRKFRDSVITLGNEMTVGFLQKYSKVPLPAQMISTKKSKRFEDHLPKIIKYIENYLPQVFAEKKLLNHVLNEIDDYLFKPLLKYLEQFPRESLDDYDDYVRGKEIAKIIRQYIIDPIDNVVPVSGPSYQQNRPEIVKYITSHAPGISRTLLNLILCKIQALVFKETPSKSVEQQSGIPPNELPRLPPNIYNILYEKLQTAKPPITNPSEEDQPGKSKTIQDYLEQEKPGKSVRPGQDPFEQEKPGKLVRPEQDPLGEDKPGKSSTLEIYQSQEDEPEKSTITEPNPSKENQRGKASKTGQDPLKEGKPEKFKPEEEGKPEGSIRPGSDPYEEPSNDETDPERDLLLKFLKKYYPEQFGDQISTGDNTIPTTQDSAPAKRYLNKEALLKFLEKFYPELLRKKQFLDQLSKNYPDVNNENPSFVPGVATRPTSSPYIVVSKPTSRPGVSGPATVPTYLTVVSETATKPTTHDYVVTKPTSTSTVSPDSERTPIPIYTPIPVASEITPIITPKPAPIPRPSTVRPDIERDPFDITPSFPYTHGPIRESPLYPTILPTRIPDKNNIREKVLERIKQYFPHVQLSGKFLQVLLKHLEKKMSGENMQPGSQSPSFDISSYIREHFPTPSREEKPNTMWEYEYPGVFNKPTPVPESSSDRYVPVIPSKDGVGIKEIEDGAEQPGFQDDQNTDEPTKPRLTEDEQIYVPGKPGTIRLPSKIFTNHNILVHHKNVYKVSRPIYPDMYRNQLLPVPNKEGTSGNFPWNDAHHYRHPMLDMSKLYDPSQMSQHPFQNIPFANAGGRVINMKYSSGGHIFSTNPIAHGNDFMRALYENNNIGSLLKPSDNSASAPQFNNIGSDGTAYSPSEAKFNYAQPDSNSIKPVEVQPDATVQDGQNQDYFNNVQLQMNNQIRAELMGLLYQNHLSPLMLRSYGQLYEKLQNGASLSDGEWKEMNELEQMFKSHAAFLQLYQQKFAQTLHGIKSLLYNMYKTLYKMGQSNREVNAKFGRGYGQNYMPGSGEKLFNFGKQSFTPNAENGEAVFRQDDSNVSELNPSEQGTPVEEVEKTESGDNLRKSAFDNLPNFGSWVKKPFFS